MPIAELDDPDNPEYTITGLDTFEIYFLTITAYDLDGQESGYSDVVFLAPAILCDTETASQSHTNKVTVDLTLAGIPCEAAEMMVAEDNDFSINATAWVPFAPETSFTFSDASEGERTVYAKLVDASQKELGLAKGKITIDTTGPSTTAMIPGGLLNSAQSVTLDCDDGAGAGCAGIYYTTDGSEPTTQSEVFTAPIDISSSATLKFFAIDAAGNMGPIGSETYVMDITAPTGGLVINSDAALTNSTSVTLSLSASDENGVADMMFSNDNATWSDSVAFATSRSWTIGSVEGPQAVYVKFKDNAGNWSSAYSDTITLDTTPPTATIAYTPTGPTNHDVIASITLSDGSVTGPGGSTYTFTENGSFTFAFADAAGNAGMATATVDWIDKTSPSSNASSPEYANGTLSVTWTALDDPSGSGVASTELWYKKEGGGTWQNTGLAAEPGTNGAFSYAPADGDGTYYFATRSTDRVGNVEAGPEGPGDASTVFDTAAPDVPIITTDGGGGAGNDYSTTDSTVTLQGTCSADTVAVYVNGSTDGVTYIPGQTSWTYMGTLQSGENIFKIVTHDAAGNVSSEETITVSYGSPMGGYVDEDVIPVAQISQSADGDGMITIHFKIKDPTNDLCTLRTFQYSVDGGQTWSAPTNRDGSGCLVGGWPDNSGAKYSSGVDFDSAAEHTFVFNTKHPDVLGLNGVDQDDVQVRFTVNDETYDSLSPVTSESFRVDNAAPSIEAFPTVDCGSNTIDVTYTEADIENATDKANYSCGPSLSFSAEDIVNSTGNTYRLAFSSIPAQTIFMLTVSNITDAAGNPVTRETVRINDDDGDAMADDWEIAYGISDPDADSDEDGLSNVEEYNNRTDPNNSDSDGDGLPDVWEVTYGLNPNDSTGDNGADGDFDKDGWTNYEEYANSSDPASDSSPDPTPPAIVKAIPHDGAGIAPDSTRISNISSFAVLIEDSDGIDITDTASVKFTIDDGIRDVYERDLSDTAVVRAIKLTSDPGSQVTKLWVVYDRANDDLYWNNYDFGRLVNIRVDAKDRREDWMVQASYDLRIESVGDHIAAEAAHPVTGEFTEGDSTTLTVASTDALDGLQVVYNNSESVAPYLSSSDEIPPLGISGVTAIGLPVNLQPPTVFDSPVRLIIPFPGQDDATSLTLYLYDGREWVYACSSHDGGGVVQPEAEGWLVPGSLVYHNGTSTPALEIKVYRSLAIQAGF